LRQRQTFRAIRRAMSFSLFNPEAVVVALGIIPFGASHPEYRLAALLLFAALVDTGWMSSAPCRAEPHVPSDGPRGYRL